MGDMRLGVVLVAMASMLGGCGLFQAKVVEKEVVRVVYKTQYIRPAVSEDMFSAGSLPVPMKPADFMALSLEGRVGYLSQYALDTMAGYRACTAQLDAVGQVMADYHRRVDAFEADQR